MPYKDRARARAQRRNRAHVLRAAVSDITAGQEAAMRRRARKCPLCGVRLTVRPGLPGSKHLDHIIPIAVGGTHTHGNVRIICASCNVRRPRDGRDYAGPVTLWAQGEVVVRRVRTTCRKGLHPWVPENIEARANGRKRCRACDRARNRIRNRKRRRDQAALTRKACRCGALFAAPGRTAMCPSCTDETARKAAVLHTGGMSWNQAAAQVGYASGEGARYAAKRVGYVPTRPPAREARSTQPNLCQCGATAWRNGKCQDCQRAIALSAAEMYNSGRTLRQVADELGYGSVTAVSNLIKTLGPVSMRVGRPASAPRAARQ